MNRNHWLAGLASLFFATAMAQSTPATPSASAASAPPAQQYGCDSEMSKQFDFWLGNWSYSGPNGSGVNRITKILDGCVILETFEGAPLKGRSFSTFDRATQKWKQTWVDNTASYLDFTGGFADGRMTFVREAEINGKKFLQRMVWFDIHPDNFQWNWERSDDGGKTWRVLWHIDYKRMA